MKLPLLDTPERALVREDRDLRALRALPRGLPHLPRAAGRDRLAPRPHLPDEGDAAGQARSPTATVLKHLDQCLDCRACETACPSGVEYGRSSSRPAPCCSRCARWRRAASSCAGSPSGCCCRRGRVQWVVLKLLWLQQVLGLTRLGAWLGRRGCCPAGSERGHPGAATSRSARSGRGTPARTTPPGRARLPGARRAQAPRGAVHRLPRRPALRRRERGHVGC